jgi:hypothetical protein
MRVASLKRVTISLAMMILSLVALILLDSRGFVKRFVKGGARNFGPRPPVGQAESRITLCYGIRFRLTPATTLRGHHHLSVSDYQFDSSQSLSQDGSTNVLTGLSITSTTL